MESPSIRDSSHPRQQIGQAVSRQNHPSVCNPACTDNVSWWKNRSRLNNAAVLISTLRNPYSSAVLLGELRRNSCICFSAAKFLKTFSTHDVVAVFDRNRCAPHVIHYFEITIVWRAAYFARPSFDRCHCAGVRNINLTNLSNGFTTMTQ